MLLHLPSWVTPCIWRWILLIWYFTILPHFCPGLFQVFIWTNPFVSQFSYPILILSPQGNYISHTWIQLGRWHFFGCCGFVLHQDHRRECPDRALLRRMSRQSFPILTVCKQALVGLQGRAVFCGLALFMCFRVLAVSVVDCTQFQNKTPMWPLVQTSAGCHTML